jgi:hypothetical protein
MFISGAASDLFSSWSARADLEDARNIAIDQVTIAVLHLHAPDMASLYVADDLPEPFERLLDRATAAAGSRDDAAFIARYRTALAALLAQQRPTSGHDRSLCANDCRCGRALPLGWFARGTGRNTMRR